LRLKAAFLWRWLAVVVVPGVISYSVDQSQPELWQAPAAHLFRTIQVQPKDLGACSNAGRMRVGGRAIFAAVALKKWFENQWALSG